MASNDISCRGLVQQEQAPAIEIVRDVYGGTLSLREKGTKYLPRQPRETLQDWQDRLSRSVLFNGVQKTADGLVGLVMRKPIGVSSELPEPLADLLDQVTASNRSNITSFATRLLRSVVLDGHALILIDFPQLAEGMSLAEELALAPRPVWNIIPASNIVAGKVIYHAGREIITSLRFQMFDTVMDGYEEKQVRSITEYRLAGDGIEWGRWVENESLASAETGKWILVDSGLLNGVTRIPAVMAHAGPTDTWGKHPPPLLDLAQENLRHYDLRSDRDKHLKIASVPIPVFTGVKNDNGEFHTDFTVGSDRVIMLPEGANAMLLEPTGAALDSSRQEMHDIQQRMAAMGLSLLQRETKSAETAEAHRIDAAHGSAALSSMANSVESALNEALDISAEWMGIDPDGLPDDAIGVNREFGIMDLDANKIRTLLDMTASGKLSLTTFWDILLRGEVLPPGFDAESERDQIELDIEADASSLGALDNPQPEPPNGGESD